MVQRMRPHVAAKARVMEERAHHSLKVTPYSFHDPVVAVLVWGCKPLHDAEACACVREGAIDELESAISLDVSNDRLADHATLDVASVVGGELLELSQCSFEGSSSVLAGWYSYCHRPARTVITSS